MADEFEKCVPIILVPSPQTEKSTINGSSNALETKDQSTKKDSTSGSSCLSNGSKNTSSSPAVPKRSLKCLRSPDDISKRGIMKNVIVLSISFVTMFAAYASLSALQSSLHLQQGMGVINQAVLYAVMAVSCLLLPKMAIRAVGHKWSMTVSLVGYVLWMGANGYGVWATMLPASVVAGMSAAVLWTTQGSYFSILAKHYAMKTKQEPAAVTSFFFGIFVAFFAFSAIFGNLLSSMILRPSSTANITHSDDDEDSGLADVCGLNDCPGTNSSKTHLARPPPPDLVWTLVGVDLAMGTVSVIICCVFIDPLPSSWIPEFESSGKNLRKDTSSSLLATARHMFRLEQLLLIPISVYMGMQYAFVDAEYTKSFISCFLAIWMVGFCLLPSAVCRGLGSIISGRVAKYTGIVPIFVYGLIVDMSFQLTLLLWSPSESQLAVFIMLPCLSTLADAVWQPQIKALYGVMFADDTASAFAVCTFFNACGCIVVFALSSLLCTRFKLYILTSVFTLGVTLLFVILFVFRRSRRSKSADVQS